MKGGKVSDTMKRFSGAIVQPIMFLGVIGIVLAIAVILNFFPGFIQQVGGFLMDIMLNGGINQLSVIFCVALTCAFAKNKKVDAAITGISMFLFFIYANNAWLTRTGMLATATEAGLNGTGQAMVLGVQVVDMGVLLGIMIGCISGYIFNKLSKVKFPDVIAIYGGTKFAFLVNMIVAILLGIVMCYVWPLINNVILALGGFIENSGNIGLFIYGFLNRALIPTGMHHLIYMPFMFTSLGGTLEIGGQMVNGAQMILLTELANLGSIEALDESVKYMMFGFSKIFGCIGITLAFIHTAKAKNKAKTRALLIPALAVAILAGITEPFDFLFIFTAPLLLFVHSALDGLFQVICFVLGSRFALPGGILTSLPFILAMPTSMTKWYITLLVGLVSIPVWYFTFVFLIKKLNLKTPGREDDEEDGDNISVKEDDKEVKFNDITTGDVNDIILGLGGKDNIVTVTNCFTRLRIDVKDINLVDEAKINRYKNSGIVKKGNNVQIIIGLKVQDVKESLCSSLGME